MRIFRHHIQIFDAKHVFIYMLFIAPVSLIFEPHWYARSHSCFYFTTLNKKFNEHFVFAPPQSWNLVRITTYHLHVIIHHNKMKILIEFYGNARTPLISTESCPVWSHAHTHTHSPTTFWVSVRNGSGHKCSFTSYHGEKLPNQEN